ncbi:MAG: hypothetical protein ACOYLO_18055, partial [Ferruginibacter sp.]
WNGNNYNTSGTYSIVLPAANINSCDSTATLNLTVTSIGANIVKQPLACPENSNGTFTATANNGTAPYEYSINNGLNWQNNGLFSNLSAGNYTLKIKDAAGCTKDSTIEINVETAVWTGTISSNWHNAGNWNTGQIPTSITHVIIESTATNECIISAANAEAASIQAKTGTVLKIENNREIIITGKCSSLPLN